MSTPFNSLNNFAHDAMCMHRCNTFVPESQQYLSLGLTTSVHVTSPPCSNINPTDLMWNFCPETTPIPTLRGDEDRAHDERTLVGMATMAENARSNNHVEQSEILFDTVGDSTVLNSEGTLEIIYETEVGPNAHPPLLPHERMPRKVRLLNYN